jgi:MFS family permease
LVDALNATGFTGALESVFARAQVISGAAMLGGTVLGGIVAQATNLGVPYLLRAGMLGITFIVAWRFMHDIGWRRTENETVVGDIKAVIHGSVEGGLRNPPVRWLMLAAPFTAGVGIYAFYALQPYLLQLYGNPNAYAVAGIASAIVAGAQIVGGLIVTRVRRLFRRRTDALLVAGSLTVVLLAMIGLTNSFVVALALVVVWAMVFAIAGPMRQAYLNGLIPSEQRATVLSFDNLMGSAGGVIAQPALGSVADAAGYGASYVVAAAIQAFSIPFVLLARREHASSDPITDDVPAPDAPPAV